MILVCLVFRDSLNARKPVEGTIARGYLKTFNYDPSLEGYLLAGREAKNPLETNTRHNDLQPIKRLSGGRYVPCPILSTSSKLIFER